MGEKILKALIENIPYKADTPKEQIKSLLKLSKFVNSRYPNNNNKRGISINANITHSGNSIFDLKRIQKSLPRINAELPKCRFCLISPKLYCDNCIFKKCEFLSKHGYDLIQQIAYLDAWDLFKDEV